MKLRIILFLLISTYFESALALLNEDSKFLDMSDKSNDLSKRKNKLFSKKVGENKVSESNLFLLM
jgi:hypothetical protein